MLSDEQRQERIRKMVQILSAMHQCSTIGEISELLDIPTSTIQRYLNKEDLYNEVSEAGYLDPKNIKSAMEYTKLWLSNAKKNGLRRGGETSQSKHGYSKDESGKFRGRGN